MSLSPRLGGKNIVFGVHLDRLMGKNGQNGLPRVLIECCAFIENEGLIILTALHDQKIKYN